MTSTRLPDVGGLGELVEIGRGGFAVVYRGRDDRFSRDVAVKVLPSGLDEAGLSRFARECRAAGALSGHPHIVTVHDSGVTASGHPYLVMELLSGGSLAERIGDGLAWQEVAELGVRLSGALETAHRAGVLHRDVKPENVLFSAYGDPKLVDFGIATVRGGYETRSSVVTATLAHAAPEIVSGGRGTVASDVYSLASTLYQALRGRPAFLNEDDETFVPLIARIVSTPVPDLRQHGVPNDISSVVELGMAKEPAQRPASARELAELLRTAAARYGLSLPAPVVDPGVARSTQPIRRPVDADGRPLIPAGGAPEIPATNGGRQATVRRPPEPAGAAVAEPPARRRTPLLVGWAVVALLLLAGAGWALARHGGMDPSSLLADRANTTLASDGVTTTSSPSATSKAAPSVPASVSPQPSSLAPRLIRQPPGNPNVTQPQYVAPVIPRVVSSPQPPRPRTSSITSSQQPAPPLVAPGSPQSVVSGGVVITHRQGGDPNAAADQIRVTVTWGQPSSGGAVYRYCLYWTVMQGVSPGARQAGGCTTARSYGMTIPTVDPADSWLRWEVVASNSAGSSRAVAAAPQVPYLVGGTDYDATQKLRGAGLRPNYKPLGPPPTPEQNYLVVRQSPTSGVLAGSSYVVIEFYEQQ